MKFPLKKTKVNLKNVTFFLLISLDLKNIGRKYEYLIRREFRRLNIKQLKNKIYQPDRTLDY